MSGAAGLSAARRRRAGGASISSTTNRVISNNTNVPVKQKRISVQSILESHELRLREVEKSNSEGDVSALVGVSETVSDNTATIKSLVDQIVALKESMAAIQTAVIRLTNDVAELSAVDLDSSSLHVTSDSIVDIDDVPENSEVVSANVAEEVVNNTVTETSASVASENDTVTAVAQGESVQAVNDGESSSNVTLVVEE